MRVIALDPGGTTGVAIFQRTEHADLDNGTWERFELKPGHHRTLWELLTGGGPWTTVIWERFMYQRRELDKGVSLSLASVEYIGICKLYEDFHEEDVTFVEQTPAQAKNLWTDNKLKTLGLYMASAPHANDATRHLLYWLTVNRGERQWVMKLKPPS
jgi:hypothetical protein